MNLDPQPWLGLKFLVGVLRKECRYFVSPDLRLFEGLFEVTQLEVDSDLAERVDAFAARFGRLQDTIGDKLLPLLLANLGEKISSALDNLDRAERLGLLNSADEWMTMRKLRNQMIHEYVEDPVLLANALQIAHSFVPVLIATADKMIAEIEQKVWTLQ